MNKHPAEIQQTAQRRMEVLVARIAQSRA
ncbi:MAG: hypothetical protein ACLSD3_11470 [Acutalibacteraceae bacterium]